MSSATPLSTVAGVGDVAAPVATRAREEDPQARFLKLLVAQVRNQDPLNPLDNAQMTSQLAQLNMVSGIEKLNQTLQGLVSDIAGAQSLNAANLIRRGVLVEGTRLELSGGQAAFGVSLPAAVDSLEVTVKDAAGRMVHTARLGAQPAGIVALQWDGATDAGPRARDGAYVFSVRAAAGGREAAVTPLAYGRVSGVTSEQGAVRLSVEGVGVIGLADVKQIN